jgi:hypothetical protein
MLAKLLAILIIVSIFLGAYNISGVKANFEPGPVQVNIISPKSYGNITNPILLNVSATMFLDPLKDSENRFFTYSIDGQKNVTMTPVYQGVFGSGGYMYSSVASQAELSDISNGWHSIMVYVEYDYGTFVNTGSARVEFVVGKPTSFNPNAPFLTVNSPMYTQVFQENQLIPYDLNISIPSAWFQNNLLNGKIYSVSYVLDNTTEVHAIAGSDAAKGGPEGPIVMNGSTPAYIPAFTAENPTIILTGKLPVQSLGNHTIHWLILWSDYGDNLMTANFQNRFLVSNEISQVSNSAIETTPTPTVPELSRLVVLPLFISLFAIAVALKIKRRKTH